MFWTMHSGIIAALAVVFARYVAYFVPLSDIGIKSVAIVAIFLLSGINYVGVRHGSLVQTLFTVGKLLAVVLMIGVGFTLGSRLPEHFVGSSSPSPVTLSNFTLALIAGLFAFGGWHMVTYSSEETMDPRRTIPRALFFGPIIVTACYIALNTVYLYVLPLDAVATSTRVAADAADRVMGFGGGAGMSGLVIFSTFGALSGIILAGPRVYYSMAQDGLLFRWLGAIHPRYRTPHRSIVMQGIWSAILVATGTYRALFTRVVYTEWIFFGLMAIGLILLRRRPDLERDYSIWGYPWVPLTFTIASFAIVITHIVSNIGEAAVGLSLVLIGLPVYSLWTSVAKRKEKSS
jgi:APA family basic amino acid/polyamine antiporter